MARAGPLDGHDATTRREDKPELVGREVAEATTRQIDDVWAEQR